MKLFADIILPLALERNYTYGVPIELQDKIRIGQRVEVQLGKRKVYSGIVKKIHTQAPEVYAVKPIRCILNEEPIVTASQIKLWTWMASYYMCTEGEVMNASLPANLKLESETFIALNEDVKIDEHELTDDEFLILQALEVKRAKKKTNTE